MSKGATVLTQNSNFSLEKNLRWLPPTKVKTLRVFIGMHVYFFLQKESFKKLEQEKFFLQKQVRRNVFGNLRLQNFTS